LEIQFGILEEESSLPRRLPAVSGDPPGGLIHDVTAVQLADPIIAESGPLPNGKGARLMVYQSQREIQALAVPRISVIGHSHGRLLPLCNLRDSASNII
jgi:hypothetical protein